LIQIDFANFQYFIFGTDTNIAEYIKFNTGTISQVHASVVIVGITVRIPSMSTDTSEHSQAISYWKSNMGSGLN